MLHLLRRAVRAFCLRTGRLEGVYRSIGKVDQHEWPEYLRRHRGMRIGAGTTVNPHCTFTDLGTVTIGRDCTITQSALLTHSVSLDGRAGRTCSRKPIVIGDRVEIFWNATIRPGTIIGDDVRIMSGTHVGGIVPDGAVMEGVPPVCVGLTRRYLRKLLRGSGASSGMNAPTVTASRPMPLLAESARAGRPSTFDGLEGDDPEQVTAKTARSIRSRIDAVLAIIAVSRGLPSAGIARESIAPIGELRIEAARLVELCQREIGEYESRFGIVAAKTFVALLAPELADLPARIVGLEARSTSGRPPPVVASNRG